MGREDTFTISGLLGEAMRNGRASRLMSAIDAVRDRDGREIANCSGLVNLLADEDDPGAQKKVQKQQKKALQARKNELTDSISTLRKAIPDLKGDRKLHRQATQNLSAAISQLNTVNQALRRL